jgi:hypothetical protein
MNLADLVATAVKTAVRKSKTPLKDLTIELARAAVRISDGNKIKSETSQGLKLSFGRRSVALDAVAAGAVKFEVLTAQVPEATQKLQALIDAGKFDTAIVACQLAMADALAEPAEKSSVVIDTTVETADVPSVDGLDLSSIG